MRYATIASLLAQPGSVYTNVIDYTIAIAGA